MDRDFGSQTRYTGAIIDVETTGLSAYKDEVIELGVLLFELDISPFKTIGIIDEYSGLREPSCPINPQASRVNGITAQIVKGQTLDNDKINSIFDRCHFFVAHNASFDKRFVELLFPQVKQKTWYCSMNGVRWANKGFKSKALQHLVQQHQIIVPRAHRAMDDVMSCYYLLQKPDNSPYMLELLRNKPHYIPEGQQQMIEQVSASIDS